ncbi:MAG: hypothetical protein M1826_007526 [Phylliscum demangeonii]|nr:MAG: hypothetical protein M1826_007526 [Phylliscum demangeonii]
MGTIASDPHRYGVSGCCWRSEVGLANTLPGGKKPERFSFDCSASSTNRLGLPESGANYRDDVYYDPVGLNEGGALVLFDDPDTWVPDWDVNV